MDLEGNELDFAGKLMGAQSYGKIDREYIESMYSSFDFEYAHGGNGACSLVTKYPVAGENPAAGDASPPT